MASSTKVDLFELYAGHITDSVIRVDVGGKLLTNQLKELVSYRQWNMMDETYVMNDVKESCCYVSSNFKQDLEICRYGVLVFMNAENSVFCKLNLSQRQSQNKSNRERICSPRFLIQQTRTCES